MDLKLPDAEPTAAEREAVDAVVGIEASNGNRVARRDRNRRHLLLPALRAAQRRVGWVTPGALGYTSRRLDVPPADAYGVATFYALLALEERPTEVLHVCTDLSCRLAGATTVPDGALPSPCLGLCERAPAALRTVAGPEPREEQIPPVSPPLPQTAGLKLLRRIAEGVDPESRPAFTALERARELGAERWGRPASSARSPTRACSAGAAPPSRPDASGTPSPATRCGRTTSSATPTSRSRGRSRTGC